MPEPRTVAPLRGAQWLVNALHLYRCAPLPWMALSFALLAMMIASTAVPLIGPIVFALLFPVFSAGLGQAAREATRGRAPMLPDLFAGFRGATVDLVTLGGIYLIGQVLATSAMTTIGGSGLAELLASGGRPPREAISERTLLGVAVGLALLLPLLMATWFAPLLVHFHRQPPFAALRASFHACLGNWRAFLVYGVALTIVALLAATVSRLTDAVPVLGVLVSFAIVGALLAVMVPVGFITVYSSYEDVFAAAPARPVEPDHGEPGEAPAGAEDVAPTPALPREPGDGPGPADRS
jgi:hypothetical protein